MNLTVSAGPIGFEGISLVHPDDLPRVEVKTCEEYLKYSDQGYFPMSNYDIKMSAFFEKTCGFLKALKNASIPSISFISDANVSLNSHELIPFSIIPNFIPEIDRRIKDYKNLSFKNYMDNYRVKKLEIFENGFSFEYLGQGVIMIELFRADLNNDGMEDILVHCYNYAVGGSLGYGYNLTITRRSNSDKFEIVES